MEKKTMPQDWFTDEERAAYKLKKIEDLHLFFRRLPYVRGVYASRDFDYDIEDKRQAAIDEKRAAYGPALTNEEHRQGKFAQIWGEE